MGDSRRRKFTQQELQDQPGQLANSCKSVQTPVMQSHYLHHTNPKIFPDPYEFKPQRWLDDPDLKSKYFMGFGRGTRICLGIK